eukprot:gnl/TRDRNA2_/TRDRNA2_203498_c0_seq1.p2 gnl/TRDRNA2_/TRDRNA2_203498_c0~~gnl/TRDRNA2_/TRDRNA2_203498_c0_seq1.p2  ORF type:complete len:121 (-),score=14.80 gnl/TRDRNA2_/TRDRNA2_203498_c0_seq1:126-488(-)
MGIGNPRKLRRRSSQQLTDENSPSSVSWHAQRPAHFRIGWPLPKRGVDVKKDGFMEAACGKSCSITCIIIDARGSLHREPPKQWVLAEDLLEVPSQSNVIRAHGSLFTAKIFNSGAILSD